MSMTFRSAILAATIFGLAAAPLVLGDFHISLLNYIGIYTLMTLGLTLLTGWTGLASFGQAAFAGVAAYSSAWLTTVYGASPWLGLLLGLALTTVVAIALGLVSLRMSGHYLPISTLAWGMAIFLLFGNLEVLGKQSGINQVPSVSVFGYSLNHMDGVFYLVWSIVGLAFAAVSNLSRSRQGRAARVMRSGRVMAESVGIDSFRVRLTIFVIASLLAAVGGWLYAHMQHYVGPAPFSPLAGIELLLMAVVGGMGSLVGALVGATFITLLRNFLQDILPYFTARAGNLEIVVFGALFILLLQHARAGIMGFFPVRQSHMAPPASVARPLARRTLPMKGELILQIENLTKRFGGLLAVDRVEFSVSAGEILGLVGPNGAGKSTIFNLISGVLVPTTGRIVLRGEEIGVRPPRYLAQRGVSRTFQHVKLRPDMTLLENVMIGCYVRTYSGFVAGALGLDRGEDAAVRAEALKQLHRVGLGAKWQEFAGNLPLGEQRVLEVARALAADPMLILLDEPAAGLRHLEKIALAALLRQVRSEGIAVLLIEHDMSFVMGLVDRLVVVDFGTKLAEGKPAEIRANKKVQRAYLGGVGDNAA